MDAFDEQTCRVCLSPDSGCIKVSSSINVRFGRISDMVLYCTGLEMTANEDLPQLICNECALHLNVAYNFKKKVLNAEKLFLDALAENEDRKRPPPQLNHLMPTTNGTNAEDLLESQVEVEQKIIPDAEMDDPMLPDVDAQNDDEPQVKYVQANIMACFDNNELIELSDTDSDSTVDDVQVIQQRANANQSRPRISDGYAPLECPVCPMIFNEPISYNEHINEHPEKRCKKCNRQCYYTSSLQIHFRTHANEMTLSCPQCDFSAKSQTVLQSHLQRYHAPPTRLALRSLAYKCKSCDRVFMTIDRLRAHLNTDHEYHIVSDTHALSYAEEVDRNELSRCKTCGRQLSSYRCLVVHMRLHERDKLNYCYICKASFRHDQNMYMHFRSQHPGEKPYKCTGGHCDMTFDLLKQYDAHMRQVKMLQNDPLAPQRVQIRPPPPPPVAPSDQSEFECYVCDDTFASQAEQISHMKTHVRFECKKCKQVYMKWRSVLEHYEQYHPNGEWSGMFICQTCGRGFPTTRSLSNHDRSHKANMTH